MPAEHRRPEPFLIYRSERTSPRGTAADGAKGRRAVFLDRDGTLMVDVGYPKEPRDVSLIPGAARALAALRASGFLLIVVSNQSGVGRKLLTLEQLEQVHQRFVGLLRRRGVEIDAALYCPHAPEERCNCRKPSPQMIQAAATEFGLDLARCYMVGDRERDVEAGKSAGCRTVLFAGADAGPTTADHASPLWPRVVRWILADAGVA
jgi:histidinol-phosphate phosphatase family protein